MNNSQTLTTRAHVLLLLRPRCAALSAAVRVGKSSQLGSRRKKAVMHAWPMSMLPATSATGKPYSCCSKEAPTRNMKGAC